LSKREELEDIMMHGTLAPMIREEGKRCWHPPLRQAQVAITHKSLFSYVKNPDAIDTVDNLRTKL
jgi:hypothetical protein